MSPRNNNIRIIFRRNNPMQVTLVETRVTLLSSTKGKVKAELTEEDSIEPRVEGFIISKINLRRRKKINKGDRVYKNKHGII